MDVDSYLDHASVWPLRPEARQAWLDATQLGLGDPIRSHGPARRAAELLLRSSESVAAVIGVEADDVVWTSGGTEAVNLAVFGTAHAAQRHGNPRRRVVVSAVEHSSVLRAAERLEHDGFRLEVVGVDQAGIVDLDALADAVDDDTLAVHVQHANHEVGAVQPTDEVARIAHRHGALLHVDACQSVGQLGLSMTHLGADLLSASACKFGGPVGIGFLALGRDARIAAMIEGDDRQRRMRAGQLDVAAIAAAGVALRVATDGMPDERSAREVTRRHLRRRLAEDVADVQVHGPLADAHPGMVAVSALYVDGSALTAELDAAGFAVHSGSSCATADGQPSHVLAAMGALTHGHVRISFGPATTVAVADRFVETYQQIVERLRRGSRRRGREASGTATIS